MVPLEPDEIKLPNIVLRSRNSVVVAKLRLEDPVVGTSCDSP